MSESVALVGIVMGSDSDWPKIKAAKAALDEFGVPCEVRVMSAHRTPDIVMEYASSAIDRGLKVIIAAAGGAAPSGGRRRCTYDTARHWATRSDRRVGRARFATLHSPNAR